MIRKFYIQDPNEFGLIEMEEDDYDAMLIARCGQRPDDEELGCYVITDGSHPYQGCRAVVGLNVEGHPYWVENQAPYVEDDYEDHLEYAEIFAPHKIDTTSEHYAEVKQYMVDHGPPTIRCVNGGDCYYAVEGSHRLAAAAELEIPILIELIAEDDYAKTWESESHNACYSLKVAVFES